MRPWFRGKRTRSRVVATLHPSEAIVHGRYNDSKKDLSVPHGSSKIDSCKGSTIFVFTVGLSLASGEATQLRFFSYAHPNYQLRLRF